MLFSSFSSLFLLFLAILLLLSFPNFSISSSFSPLTSAASGSSNSASELNAKAIEFAESGDLDSALSYFRRAVKKSPSTAEYHNNLGVTLMRLESFDSALESFASALNLDSNHRDAKQNLKDLKEYMKNNSNENKKKKNKKSKKNSKRKQIEEDEEEETEEEEEEEEMKKPSKKSKKKSKSTPDVEEEGLPHPVTGILRRLNTNNNKPFPRISIQDLYKPENSYYRDGKSPMIITGAMENWNIQRDWSLDYFQSRFGDSITDFYPHNMDKADTHPFLTPMKKAVNELFQPSVEFPSNKDGYPGTYIQWNIHWHDWNNLTAGFGSIPYQFVRDDTWINECLRSDSIRDQYVKRTHWKMILIANKGAGMFNHQDVLRTASWQAQLAGSKRWFICAPDQSQYLYGAGKIDLFNPDYEKFPLYRQARCYTGVVKNNEMIFYPRDYWHQTENLETPSISVSASIMDENNYQEIWNELLAECTSKKYNWQFNEELCEDLKNVCKPLWEIRYSNNPIADNEFCPVK